MKLGQLLGKSGYLILSLQRNRLDDGVVELGLSEAVPSRQALSGMSRW
jgi:hypothetical protein